MPWWYFAGGAIGAVLLAVLLMLVVPSWRGFLRRYPVDESEQDAAFWAQHSSGKG
ncbi:MAG: hypothetical protein QM747_11740 [Nocardioides sp.]